MSRSTKHFVYILQSGDGRYYTGYTTDLERRMEQHRTGRGARFTRGFGFKKLLHHETFRTRSKAMRREAEIKGWSRVKKKRLIRLRQNTPRFCRGELHFRDGIIGET